MKWFIVVLATLMVWSSSIAQTTKDILIQFTDTYFEAYNNCDVNKILELSTDDIEVYHDLIGLIDGKTELGKQSKKFCDWIATPAAPNVKAELVGDLNIHELKTINDNLYGAVITGTINFFDLNKQTGIKTLTGTSDFTWILTLTGDKWQIKRDISYNHQETK